MKKILTEYYAIFVFGIFLLCNIIFKDIHISGTIYEYFMYFIIGLNAIFLTSFRQKMKYCNFVIIAYIVFYIILWMYSKNVFQFAFGLSNMLILIVISSFYNIKSRTISFIILILGVLYFPIVTFIAFGMILFISEKEPRRHIYPEMHYYCDDDIEVYAFSGGATDSYHYNLDHRFEFKITHDLNLIFTYRKSLDGDTYSNYIYEHDCKH